MNIKTRQRRYGLLYGLATFLTGWGITALLTSTHTIASLPRWKSTLWFYLSAHFLSATTTTAFGLPQQQQLLQSYPALQTLVLLPPLLIVIGGLLMIDIVGYTTRFTSLLENSASLLIGYLGTALVAFVASGIQPGVSLLILLGVVVATALYLGSLLANRLTAGIPVFALTSLGGLLLVGLLVLLGGVAVLNAIWPLFAVAAIASIATAVLGWIARQTPT